MSVGRLCACGCGGVVPPVDRRGNPTIGTHLRGHWMKVASRQRQGRFVEHFWERVAAPDDRGCRLWLGPTNRDGGYGVVSNGRRDQVYAHRLVWILAYGEPPADRPWVLHRCDNPPCCELTHLFIGTAADNNADMAAKMRNRVPHSAATGERNPAAKITDAQRDEIVYRYRAGGIRQVDLAAEYGITQGQISHIIRKANQHTPSSPEAGI